MSDLNDFLSGGKVDTRNKLICDGHVGRKRNPTQISFRLPLDQMTWIRQNIPRNANYAVSVIIQYGIDHIKNELTTGEFDIDNLVFTPEV